MWILGGLMRCGRYPALPIFACKGGNLAFFISNVPMVVLVQDKNMESRGSALEVI